MNSNKYKNFETDFIRCPDCGNYIDKDSMMCRKCGYDVEKEKKYESTRAKVKYRQPKN